MQSYKVITGESGLPVVVDDTGQAVEGGKVHRVTFPDTCLNTSDGPVWVINGPGEAVISVSKADGGREFVTNVPLG